jgi:hypothetical protein
LQVGTAVAVVGGSPLGTAKGSMAAECTAQGIGAAAGKVVGEAGLGAWRVVSRD